MALACTISFLTNSPIHSLNSQETETGLYICMTNHYAFGKKYVEAYSKKTGNRVFLHMRRKRKVSDMRRKVSVRLLMKMVTACKTAQPPITSYRI